MLFHYLVLAGDNISYVAFNYQIKEYDKDRQYLPIPAHATFATRHNDNPHQPKIVFRQSGQWHDGEDWLQSMYNKEYCEKEFEIVWERDWIPTVIKESSRGIKIKDLSEVVNPDVLNINWKVEYFKKWLEGKPIQYKLGGTHWHNMTENSLSYFSHNNVQLRDRPTEIEIDGKLFSPEQAINYLKNNYLKGD